MSIELKISDAHWNELRYQHREAEFFPEEDKPLPTTNAYTWFPAEVTINGRNLGAAEVRKKGYIGSNDPRRPGLKLRVPPETENKTPDKSENKSGGSKSAAFEVTLNNNLQDPSFIRQSLAYEVFRRANIPVPRCAFAKVVVNGKDLGIYTGVEPINETFLKDRFGSSKGNLYEGGRSDFRSNWVQNFVIKKGQKDNRADLERATAAVEKSTDSIMPALNAHFDAEEFFRFWAVESLLNTSDGYAANMNNFYLYRDPSTDRFVFIPWGPDATFHQGRPLNSVRGDPKSIIGTGLLANRLYNSKDGAEKYRATLRGVLKDVWNEGALLREVNRLESLLSPAVGPQAAYFKQGVDGVRQFVRQRRAEITPELEGPAPALKSKPIEFAKRRNVGQFAGKFSTTLGRDAASAKSATLSGTLWDKKITFREISVQSQLPDADSDDRLVIYFSGSTPDDKQYVLYLAIDSDSYVTGKPIPIDNTHIYGMVGSQERIGMLRGSLTLTKASKTPGGEISGEFNADVFSKLSKP